MTKKEIKEKKEQNGFMKAVNALNEENTRSAYACLDNLIDAGEAHSEATTKETFGKRALELNDDHFSELLDHILDLIADQASGNEVSEATDANPERGAFNRMVNRLDEEKKQSMYTAVDALMDLQGIERNGFTTKGTFRVRADSLNDEKQEVLADKLFELTALQLVDSPEGAGIKEAVTWLWHSMGALRIKRFDTAIVALQHVKVHEDPDGAVAALACVEEYISSIIEDVHGHLKDMEKMLAKIYPPEKLFSGQTLEDLKW